MTHEYGVLDNMVNDIMGMLSVLPPPYGWIRSLSHITLFQIEKMVDWGPSIAPRLTD
jgi:hypothetical protein